MNFVSVEIFAILFGGKREEKRVNMNPTKLAVAIKRCMYQVSPCTMYLHVPPMYLPMYLPCTSHESRCICLT